MKRHDDPGAPRVDWAHVRARLEQAQATVLSTLSPDPAASAALLDARARRLARPEVNAEDAADTLELVFFEIGTTRYGIGAQYIHRIMKAPHLTPIAGVQRPFLGVIAWLARVLPVVALERLFDGGLDAEVIHDGMVLIVGEEVPEFGLLATRVDQVVRVPATSVR